MQPLYLVEEVTGQGLADDLELMFELAFVFCSLLLLGAICLLILRQAERLSAPLRALAERLRGDADQLAQLPEPAPGSSAELVQLTQALNSYRTQIAQGIERERAFSRYVSHELRTPLTVARGVASLLQVSSEPAFLDKQQRRLERACQDMDAITETLLALVREETASMAGQSQLGAALLETLVADNRALLADKPVEVRVEALTALELPVPEAVLRMLVGNLLRNAFAYTQTGTVVIRLDGTGLSVTDTGIGLTASSEQQGHGLGLLLVRDICSKFDWHFSLKERQGQPGCIAKIEF